MSRSSVQVRSLALRERWIARLNHLHAVLSRRSLASVESGAAFTSACTDAPSTRLRQMGFLPHYSANRSEGGSRRVFSWAGGAAG